LLFFKLLFLLVLKYCSLYLLNLKLDFLRGEEESKFRLLASKKTYYLAPFTARTLYNKSRLEHTIFMSKKLILD
jgi:hypothetical protein